MEFIKVGQIIGTFGVKGQVKVFPLTVDINRFSLKNEYYIGKNKIKVHIHNFRKDKKILIVSFDEYNNINDVLTFKDEYIYISDEDLLDLEEDSYYIHELIGLKVYENDRFLGLIEKVIENASNDIYIIKKNNEKNIFVPAVKQFIKDIDLNAGIMKVELIEGMDDEI